MTYFFRSSPKSKQAVMKRIFTLITIATLAVSCGWLADKKSSAEEPQMVEEAAPEAMDVDVMAKFKDVDLEAMNVEERVDYYLSRYAHESTLEDKSISEATRTEMLEWLQSLSDEDKRRADDASDLWYGRNVERF